MDNLDELIDCFETTLTRSVHDLVREFKSPNVAYCLALNYSDDPPNGCIPVLGLGMLKLGEVNPLLPTGLVIAEEWYWNPAEFSSFGCKELQPQDAELLQIDRELRFIAHNGICIDLRGICIRVAKKLNKLEWIPLSISNKFIVYAVDDDLVDLKDNLVIAIDSMMGRAAT
jgi:hypothetical protein